MDAQMKRGFLEMCVLASLQERDSYGYQIVKDVPDILGLTESTLYPLLKRLEKAECLTAYSVEHNGRLRKYYRLMPAGEERIAEFLSEQADIMSIYPFLNSRSTADIWCGKSAGDGVANIETTWRFPI